MGIKILPLQRANRGMAFPPSPSSAKPDGSQAVPPTYPAVKGPVTMGAGVNMDEPLVADPQSFSPAEVDGVVLGPSSMPPTGAMPLKSVQPERKTVPLLVSVMLDGPAKPDAAMEQVKFP